MGEELLQGANYQILLQFSEDKLDPNVALASNLIVHKITSENELHIFLLLPQFVIMTAGEIMFSITSLQFSFTQVIMVFCYQNCSDLLWEKKCYSDHEKLLKFETEGWEFAKFLRSLK